MRPPSPTPTKARERGASARPPSDRLPHEPRLALPLFRQRNPFDVYQLAQNDWPGGESAAGCQQVVVGMPRIPGREEGA